MCLYREELLPRFCGGEIDGVMACTSALLATTISTTTISRRNVVIHDAELTAVLVLLRSPPATRKLRRILTK